MIRTIHPLIGFTLLVVFPLPHRNCEADETTENSPIRVENKITAAAPQLTKEQRELGSRLKELYKAQPSITAVLRRPDLELERALELLPEQAKTLQQIVDKRFKDQIADEEACALVKADNNRDVQSFLKRIRELEKKREESAIETIREVLLPHQQDELGELIVKRCDLDLFSLPFAEDILKLTPQQYARMAAAQRAANQAFQKVIDQTKSGEVKLTKAQLDARMKPHALSMLRATLDVLDEEQLITLLTLRGGLKEGQTLRQLATTLPPELRVLLGNKLDQEARAKSL